MTKTQSIDHDSEEDGDKHRALSTFVKLREPESTDHDGKVI